MSINYTAIISINYTLPTRVFREQIIKLKLDKDSEIESCQEYKYLGVIFDTSGTDDKEIRSRVIQARKCIACLNGILWSKGIRKERKLNIMH